MARSKLRVYHGPEELSDTDAGSDTHRESVSLRLGDLLPMLADAMLRNRGWLDDFASDEITISSDLYDVLMAYEHFARRPSA